MIARAVRGWWLRRQERRAVLAAWWAEHGETLPRYLPETGQEISWDVQALWYYDEPGMFDHRSGKRLSSEAGRWKVLVQQRAPGLRGTGQDVWRYDEETKQAVQQNGTVWR